MPILTAFVTLGQKDCCEFRFSLGYTVKFQANLGYRVRPSLKTKT